MGISCSRPENDTLQQITTTFQGPHWVCRQNTYPKAPPHVLRVHVPDDKISWDVKFADYNPPEYNNSILDGAIWADNDDSLRIANFNSLEVVSKIDRRSHIGSYNLCATTGLPLNPHGRTGIRGRGKLGRWGPNHAADPIVTRWKRTESGLRALHPISGKPILEFVSIQRSDDGTWAIPGGMVDVGENISGALKREFFEEALNSIESSEEKLAVLRESVKELFQRGITVYKGYVDDPRNTDNSWLETVAVNFHDESGTTLGKISLEAGDDAKAVRWCDIDHNMKLYASHKTFLQPIACMRLAHW